jgi:hypothetical protein
MYSANMKIEKGSFYLFPKHERESCELLGWIMTGYGHVTAILYRTFNDILVGCSCLLMATLKNAMSPWHMSVDQPTTSSKTPHCSFPGSWKCNRTDPIVPLLMSPKLWIHLLSDARQPSCVASCRCSPMRAGRPLGGLRQYGKRADRKWQPTVAR